MRIRSIAAAILVATATVGTVLLTTQAAGGQTVLHVVTSTESPGAVKFVDVGRDGLRLGDRLAARGPLLNETKTERVGTLYLECMVFKRIADPSTGLWNCTYILELEDGEIVLKGLDPRGPGASEFAVLGGTGAYAGATGDATFTDSDTPSGGQTDMVIRLSD